MGTRIQDRSRPTKRPILRTIAKTAPGPVAETDQPEEVEKVGRKSKK